jgi:hypothetical protein
MLNEKTNRRRNKVFDKKRCGENESEISKAVSVFDTFTWPEDLEGFGKEEIKILGKHFSKYFDKNEETGCGEAFKNIRPS